MSVIEAISCGLTATGLSLTSAAARILRSSNSNSGMKDCAWIGLPPGRFWESSERK